MSDPKAPSEAAGDEVLAAAVGGVDLPYEGAPFQPNGSYAGHADKCTCELCWP